MQQTNTGNNFPWMEYENYIATSSNIEDVKK